MVTIVFFCQQREDRFLVGNKSGLEFRTEKKNSKEPASFSFQNKRTAEIGLVCLIQSQSAPS